MNQNILDFGAVADGKTLCHSAIQAAIDACAATGGGRVTIPAGTFLSGTIWLKSNVELHLEHGAILKASTNMDDYNELDAYPQNFSVPVGEEWVGKHLIIALEQENVALTGTGILDGSGDFFFGEPQPYSANCWRKGLSFAKDKNILRPGQLVCFIESRDITVRDITMRNMPSWGCFLHGCDNVTVCGMKSFSPPHFQNTDAIDIDCCCRVTVSDCIFQTGDDAFAIRCDNARLKNKDHPCEYITISNCVIASESSAFRIGVGTGTIRHVRVSNIVVTRTSTVMNFMTGYCGRGHVCIEDVHFSNISACDSVYPLRIGSSTDAYVRDVTVEHMRVDASLCLALWCHTPGVVSNITLRDIQFKRTKGLPPITENDRVDQQSPLLIFKGIDGLTLEDIRVSAEPETIGEWECALKIENCTNLRQEKVTLPQ